MKLHGTMTVNNDELYIGGVSCLELSKNIKLHFMYLMKL